ncbi:MAG: HYR domain-containing protein, partial [Pseudomonadales bacterium]|nr:HYR domain-containing protein [Pseudomonadales bacterium]
GVTSVTCAASDSAGNTTSAQVAVTVLDVTPPVLSLPADVRVPAASGSAQAVVEFTPSATDAIDGAVNTECSSPTGASFPFGESLVTCTALDAAGNTVSGSFTVAVYDAEPPALILSSAISEISQRNHKMILIPLEVDVRDAIDPAVQITGLVVSSDPDNGRGDGNTTGDIQFISTAGATVSSTTDEPVVAFVPDQGQLWLRAERSGRNTDRIYTITITATDQSGNQTSDELTVTVPHETAGKKGHHQQAHKAETSEGRKHKGDHDKRDHGDMVQKDRSHKKQVNTRVSKAEKAGHKNKGRAAKTSHHQQADTDRSESRKPRGG